MKRFLATFLAVTIAIVLSAPPARAAVASVESIQKNDQRFPQRVIVGGAKLFNSSWLGPSLVFRPSTSYSATLDTSIVATTPSAARTYTIPDAGADANFVLSTGTQGSPSFSSIILKGTSFNDTIQAISTQAQASSLTVDDIGGAAGFIHTFTSAQAAPGVLSRADAVTETGVTIKRGILDGRYLDGSVLAPSAGAGKLGIGTTATFGSPATLSLVTEVANSSTKTDDVEYEVTLPPDYVAGSAITVAVTQAITIGAGTLSTKTLTVDAFKVAADGTVGSNLGPAAQNLTNASSTLSFAITPTGLVAGDKLLIQLQTVLTETGASNVTANLTSINITSSVKM